MQADHPVPAAEATLEVLEAGIDELIRCHARLLRENTMLRAQLAVLAGERTGLLEKSRQVQGRVEQIIERLAALEQEL